MMQFIPILFFLTVLTSSEGVLPVEPLFLCAEPIFTLNRTFPECFNSSWSQVYRFLSPASGLGQQSFIICFQFFVISSEKSIEILVVGRLVVIVEFHFFIKLVQTFNIIENFDPFADYLGGFMTCSLQPSFESLP